MRMIENSAINIIQILKDGDKDNENGDIAGFWDLLSRDRKKEIFNAMNKI